MSPMFTVCHEERRMMRGARPSLAKTGASEAARAEVRKWRRFMRRRSKRKEVVGAMAGAGRGDKSFRKIDWLQWPLCKLAELN